MFKVYMSILAKNSYIYLQKIQDLLINKELFASLCISLHISSDLWIKNTYQCVFKSHFQPLFHLYSFIFPHSQAEYAEFNLQCFIFKVWFHVCSLDVSVDQQTIAWDSI